MGTEKQRTRHFAGIVIPQAVEAVTTAEIAVGEARSKCLETLPALTSAGFSRVGTKSFGAFKFY